MKEELEKHLAETFKTRDNLHYLSLLQRIKSFADAQLTETSAKNEQERNQALFAAILNIRDIASVELIEYTMCKRVEASIVEHNEKLKQETEAELQEEEDLETFATINSSDQKKS